MPSKKKSANGTKNGRGAKGSRGKADTRTKSEDFTARLGEKAVETVERKVVSMPSSPARNGDGIGKEERRALDSLDNVGTIEETNTTSKPRLSPCKTPALDSENELVNGACLSNLEDSLPSPASPASDHATVSSHYRTYTHSSDAGSEIGANSHGFADQDAISQVSISDVEDGEAETFLECEDADDESDAGKIAKKDSPKGEREVVKSGVKSKFRAPHCKLSEDGESWAAHSVAPSKRTASVANLRRTGSRSPSESFADMETNGVEKSPADGKRFRVDDSEDRRPVLLRRSPS
ncbi:hypothetical protein BC829DRAFT_97537 [Chytridium lagenaria]|nr:hypothetical protein BC829DRAFT_97537 [Chytridium lagenaria]